MNSKILAALALTAACGSSHAIESWTGKVISLYPTQLPGKVLFMMDTGSRNCGANAFITFERDAATNKVVYATLLTAVATNRNVAVHMNDGERGCRIFEVVLMGS